MIHCRNERQVRVKLLKPHIGNIMMAFLTFGFIHLEKMGLIER